MTRSVFKQVVIIFLIIIVSCLILAVVFYQYLPNNKVVPAKVSAYATPQNIASEISETNTTEYQSTQQTYDLTDSDLATFKSKKSYNPGKSDPFDEYNGIDETANATASENSSETGVESKNSKGSNVDKNTTDNYYTAAGVGRGTK